MVVSLEMEQGASQPSTMSRPRCLHEDPVIGAYSVSEELQPILATSPFKRLRRLKQLGVFMAAEHSRYGHSISVGVLARRLGECLSRRLLVDEDAAGPDVVISVGAVARCRKNQDILNIFKAQDCRATKQELLQLELAGFAHDLGHGPWSHLWERYMHSIGGAEGWSHEDMSEKLLDAAVQEAVTSYELPKYHFLRNPDNVDAVKAMIRGDAGGVPAPKKWLYNIVCNDRSGLDVDKLDYLLRDQHMVFGRCPKGYFHTYSQLDTLFNHARVVAVMDPDSSELVTDIAFENTRNQELIRLVDGIFQTRRVMHELVYRHGDVIATEERMLHLLRSVPQGNCEWIRKSRLPEKFLQLDDSLLEKLEEQHPQLHGEVQMLEGPSGGWRAVGSPWIVPEALAPATRTISVLQQQIEMMILPEVAQDVAGGAWKALQGRLQVRMAAVGDGAKCGSMRAVRKVPFFSGDGPLPSVEWIDAESLKRVYPVGAEACTPCKRIYCHLQCWHGTEGPNSSIKLPQEPSEHEVNEKLSTAFDRRFTQFVEKQLAASSWSSAATAAAAAVSSGDDSKDETPKAHKCGTVYNCRITQKSEQLQPEWQGARRSLAPEAAVTLSGLSAPLAVDTPPRKRAREEDNTPVSELLTMGAVPVATGTAAAPAVLAVGAELPPQKKFPKAPAGKMETIPDTDDEGEDEENQGGGILTQPGASLSLAAIYTAD